MAALLLPLTAAPGTADDSSPELFERIGALPRFGPDTLAALGDDYRRPDPNARDMSGTAVMLREVRQLWQFYPYFSGTRTKILVRDLDTLEIIRRLDFGRLADGVSGASGDGDWLYTVDPGRRIFLLNNENSRTGFKVVTIDLRTFSVHETLLPTQPQQNVGGIGYDPHGDAVLLAFGGPFGTASGNFLTSIVRVSLKDDVVSQPRRVRSCSGPMPSLDTPARTFTVPIFVADETSVFLPCTRAGNVAAVVRLARADIASPASAEEFVTGPVNVQTVMLDAEARRFHTVTSAGAIWVFDVATMSYVGVVAAHPGQDPGSPLLGYGLDEVTGRVFFLGPEYGLGVMEGRAFPVAQAQADATKVADGQLRIISDAPTGRVFVMPNGASAYDVYRLRPPLPPPSPPDPDLSTVDVAEQEGVTESRFTASASGYGARALLSNGVVPLLPLQGVGALNPGADLFVKHLQSPCWFSDRELQVGRVHRTEADTGSTAASAIAGDLDPRSKQDLEKPSRCDITVSDGENPILRGLFGTVPGAPGALDQQVGSATKWNRDAAVCTSGADGEPVTGAPDDHGSAPLGTSAVTCAVPDGKRVTSAAAQGSLTGPVTVGRAASWTEIRREARGVVTTAHAVAGNIDLGGLVRIAEVRSSATSVSNGRPSAEPLSQHTVSISGLSIGSTVVCAGTCDARQAVDALNTIAAGRVQFRAGAGSADAGLQQGSPKGALTAVQKSPQRQVSDQALLADFTVEIPALEMIVYNDNFRWGPARQVYQFAGVATASNYTIVRLPKGVPFDLGAELGGVGMAGLTPAGAFVPGTPGTPGTPGVALDGTALNGEGVLLADDGGSGPGGVRGAVGDAVTAIADGLRLVWSNPRQALLLFTAWLLLAQPVLLARRRRLLQGVRTA